MRSTEVAEASQQLSLVGNVNSRMIVASLVLLATALGVLPSVTTQTLAGERVVLPHDLSQPAIFVAGFTKASRAETEPWARRLREDSRVSTRVHVYEVSILDGVPGFLRAMILRQMRTGVAPARQQQFLIVTDAIESWKRALGTAGSDDHASLILVQPAPCSGAAMALFQSPHIRISSAKSAAASS
jgi:hypothetical protein